MGRTEILREIGIGVGDYRVELVGHSVYNRAGEHQPPQPGQPALTFRTVSGGSVEELIKIAQLSAIQEKELGRPTIYLVALFQNTIAHQANLNANQVTEHMQTLAKFFRVELHNYHRLAFINVIRCPELNGHSDTINTINRLCERFNSSDGQSPCDPGKTLEKTKSVLRRCRDRNGRKLNKGKLIKRVIQQPNKWREHLNGTGPGYHPHVKSMPAIVSYLRNWAKHYKVN